jgi:hypothetical protein
MARMRYPEQPTQQAQTDEVRSRRASSMADHPLEKHDRLRRDALFFDTPSRPQSVDSATAMQLGPAWPHPMRTIRSHVCTRRIRCRKRAQRCAAVDCRRRRRSARSLRYQPRPHPRGLRQEEAAAATDEAVRRRPAIGIGDLPAFFGPNQTWTMAVSRRVDELSFLTPPASGHRDSNGVGSRCSDTARLRSRSSHRFGCGTTPC